MLVFHNLSHLPLNLATTLCTVKGIGSSKTWRKCFGWRKMCACLMSLLIKNNNAVMGVPSAVVQRHSNNKKLAHALVSLPNAASTLRPLLTHFFSSLKSDLCSLFLLLLRLRYFLHLFVYHFVKCTQNMAWQKRPLLSLKSLVYAVKGLCSYNILLSCGMHFVLVDH